MSRFGIVQRHYRSTHAANNKQLVAVRDRVCVDVEEAVAIALTSVEAIAAVFIGVAALLCVRETDRREITNEARQQIDMIPMMPPRKIAAIALMASMLVFVTWIWNAVG